MPHPPVTFNLKRSQCSAALPGVGLCSKQVPFFASAQAAGPPSATLGMAQECRLAPRHEATPGEARRIRAVADMVPACPACAADPAADYEVVRQELALYNPAYCARPHAVALNKMDLEDAAALAEEVEQDIVDAARRMQVQTPSFSSGEVQRQGVCMHVSIRTAEQGGTCMVMLRRAAACAACCLLASSNRHACSIDGGYVLAGVPGFVVACCGI